MASRKIMVQVSNYRTTLEMLHLACAMAGDLKANVVMVEMVAAQHPGWLDTDFGIWSRAEQARREIASYRATAEDYGVEIELQPFQYITLVDAIADAADYVDADSVFANIPESIIPFWRRFQIWLLRRRLARCGRRLYLPDQETNTTEGVPFVVAPAGHK
jgi:hypothetical protein